MSSKTIVNEVSSLLWHGVAESMGRSGFFRKGCISLPCPLAVLEDSFPWPHRARSHHRAVRGRPGYDSSVAADRMRLGRSGTVGMQADLLCPGHKGHDLSCH